MVCCRLPPLPGLLGRCQSPQAHCEFFLYVSRTKKNRLLFFCEPHRRKKNVGAVRAEKPIAFANFCVQAAEAVALGLRMLYCRRGSGRTSSENSQPRCKTSAALRACVHARTGDGSAAMDVHHCVRLVSRCRACGSGPSAIGKLKESLSLCLDRLIRVLSIVASLDRVSITTSS